MNYKDFIKGDTLKIAESLVSISDFSKGKTSKIFDHVQHSNAEYIVLKNNKPAAVVVSMPAYREFAEKAYKLDLLLEYLEEIRLSDLAESRMNSDPKAQDFFDFVKEQGFSLDEIMDGYEDVEIE